jgi:hypothetical protein
MSGHWDPNRRRELQFGHQAVGRRFYCLADRECLLEIDLTLTVTGLRNDRLHGRSHFPKMEGACPLDAMGHCDPSRTAKLLWSLNQVANCSHTVKRVSAERLA